MWLPRDKETVVMLEMLRPNVEALDSDAFSASFFLGGRLPLNDRIAIVGEIPFVRHENPNPTSGVYFFEYLNGETIGNPYIGVEAGPPGSPFFFEVGGRFPLASDSEQFPLYTGRSVDQTRAAAFMSDVTTLQVAINIREISERAISYRLRVCPELRIDENTNDDLDGAVHYSFEIGYVGRAIRIGTGMSGSALLNDYFFIDRNLGARTSNQVDLRADFLSGSIRPGLGVRMPLGSSATYFPVVLGVTLSWVP